MPVAFQGRMRLAWLVPVALLAAACGDSSTPGGAIDASTAPDGAGNGEFCGGIAGIECADGFFCDFPDNRCGFDDGGGTCQPRPTGCPDNYDPTCGCDGTVHGNECDAMAAGADLNDHGSCTPPTDVFPCGHGYCAVDVEYCRRIVSDVANYPDDWECIALPAGCSGNPTCACLAGETCGDMCTDDGGGDLRLTCPGG